MRITMIYTNRNRYLCPAPIGALHVTARLKRDGHEVEFVDLMHVRNPEQALSDSLVRKPPDLICLSVRNVDNMQMRDLDRPLERIAGYAAVVRQHTTAPILIGGTAVTTFPRETRRKLGADYAFTGDDVEQVSRFITSLARNAADLTTPGLVWEDDEGVHCNPYRIQGYAGARFDGWEQVELKRYYRAGYYDCGVVTCTGCPHGCSFCDAHRTFGREHLPRDPVTIVEELRELQDRYRARSVFLINSGLNCPLEHGKEVLRRIVEARLRLSFSCIVEPGPFDAEFAKLLYRANCNAAMIFGSTLDDAVLERNQPHYRSAEVFRIARLLAEARVPYMLGLLFGGIGETLTSVAGTLEAARMLKPAMLITSVGLRIQPDTPLQRAAVEEGAISADESLFEPHFYSPPQAPPEEMWRVVKRFRRRHPLLPLRMISFMARVTKEGLFGRPGRFEG